MPKDKKLDPKRVDQVGGVRFQAVGCYEFWGKKQCYVTVHSGYGGNTRSTPIYNLIAYKPRSTTSTGDILGRNLTMDEVKDIVEELEEIL